MKNKNIFGFTLVELIVVITILAILGTIAFIALQWYTSFARNSVRFDSISKLAVVIENAEIQGKSLLAFALTWQEVTGASIAGKAATAGVDYKAGIANSSAFGIKADQYRDPLTEDEFRVWVTDQSGGQYEVASIIEEWTVINGKVIGTWTPRISTTLAGAWNTWESTFLLSNPLDINFFKLRDTVSGTGVPANTTITNISSDGATITLTNNFTWANTGIALAESEVSWLIAGYDNSSNIIIEGGTILPYSN